MPCYDPPPHWEGEAKENAEQAVRLLCGFVSERIREGDSTLPPEFVFWFIKHREIDLQKMDWSRVADQGEYDSVISDIQKAKSLFS